jgi:hypothetical protein
MNPRTSRQRETERERERERAKAEQARGLTGERHMHIKSVFVTVYETVI